MLLRLLSQSKLSTRGSLLAGNEEQGVGRKAIIIAQGEEVPGALLGTEGPGEVACLHIPHSLVRGRESVLVCFSTCHR